METVLIADDHEIVRHGIRMMIENLYPEYNSVEASSCSEVMQALASHEVSYAILDMYLSDGNIFSSIDQIIECHPKTNVLVYSMNAERIYARRLIEKGVKGFVCKRASMDELEKAIHSIFNGEIYLSQELKEALVRSSRAGQSDNPIHLLSDRELEVTEFIAIGLGAKEIAQKMNLDITTVSTYRRRAFQKLNVQNAIELKDKFEIYKELL
ncbi:MAG: response regulator [Chitinophagaceae bacterium]